MLNNIKKNIQQNRNFLRLVNKRLEAYEHEYSTLYEVFSSAREAVNQRETNIRVLKNDTQKLTIFVKREDVLHNMEKMEWANTRKFWIHYDLEREEYYLKNELYDLEEAQKTLDVCKAKRLKEDMKMKEIEKNMITLKNKLQSEHDNLQDIELDDQYKAVLIWE